VNNRLCFSTILLFNLGCFSTISAMQVGTHTAVSPAVGSPAVGSPTVGSLKTVLTPKEVATAVTLKLFDKPDSEVISAFTRIISRDPKGNLALLELRYRMIERLEAEALCEESR